MTSESSIDSDVFLYRFDGNNFDFEQNYKSLFTHPLFKRGVSLHLLFFDLYSPY